jgi:hypothetical protein
MHNTSYTNATLTTPHSKHIRQNRLALMPCGGVKLTLRTRTPCGTRPVRAVVSISLLNSLLLAAEAS